MSVIGERRLRVSDGQAAHGQLDMLCDAIWRTPIPSSPLPSDPYREALGLNLLSLALRLDHVDRLSESLHLVDSTHMTRSVAVDVNLARLTAAQRKALRPAPHVTDDRPPSIWLPLDRQARTDRAPILVRDAVGSVLTTLTHRATVRSLSQGLRRAFMIWLDSNPDAHLPGHQLHELRHHLYRSSWLIEAALTNLVENGTPNGSRTWLDRADGVEHTRSVDIRRTAQAAVESLFASSDNPFLRLLEMVSSEHLLVAEVSTAQDHIFLRYDAPVLPALDRGRHQKRHTRRRWRPPPWVSLEHEFTVTYETVIPRAVNSYHVTVEVPEEIRVRRIVMTSDNDAHAVRLLVADMRALANRYDDLRRLAPDVLELELQSIVSRAAEVGRRRHRDLESYKAYVVDCYRSFTQRQPGFRKAPSPPKDAETLFAELGDGDRIVERLLQLAEMQESTDHLRHLTGKLDKRCLENWAQQIERSDLRLDLYVDNDPRENAGHTHWGRRTFGASSQSAEPVKATVFAALVDDPPSLAASVGRLLLAVVGLVVALAALLGLSAADLTGALRATFRGALPAAAASERTPLGTADALVTVLLLVPGLMLSRLDIPSHRTVLGRLRLFSRYVAYAAVTVSVVLALVVATRPLGELVLPVAMALSLLALIVAFVLVDGVLKAGKRRSRVPNKEAVPRWLIDEIRRSPRRRRRRTAVEFSTIGGGSHV
jgi:hypothetical protein